MLRLNTILFTVLACNKVAPQRRSKRINNLVFIKINVLLNNSLQRYSFSFTYTIVYAIFLHFAHKSVRFLSLYLII